jgi:imidazolonepropionase-like amidohydrolase
MALIRIAYLVAVAAFVVSPPVSLNASDAIPGAPQQQPVALVGGTVFPVSGPALKNGTVLFDKGRIVAVGSADEVSIPADAKTINCRGRHVYPGLFEAHSQLGLTEVTIVRKSAA